MLSFIATLVCSISMFLSMSVHADAFARSPSAVDAPNARMKH